MTSTSHLPLRSWTTQALRLAVSCLAWVVVSTTGRAQELNCTVTVIAPQISNVDVSRFDALEDGIREFMNGRRWTNDNFEF